jgi:signal-transduction protein with cAMP-binding, CBS, and nucleotidyltransferase domain
MRILLMEELLALRQAIEEQRYVDALLLLEEMEEMSREDKINKMDSFAVILLLHLIKQQVEQRTTRSWDLSIHNAVRQIQRINKRRKSGGVYLQQTELAELLAEAFPTALKMAAIEAFAGQLSEAQLAKQVDRKVIEQQALGLIWVVE